MLDIFTLKENELYGSEIPKVEEDFRQLKKVGIDVIISLTDEIQPIKKNTTFLDEFEHIELYITDFKVPTKNQVDNFLKIIEENRKEKKKTVVHCYAGCGRTGLMLALAERFIYGVNDGVKAIQIVRKVRPCAIENKEQQEFVINYKR